MRILRISVGCILLLVVQLVVMLSYAIRFDATFFEAMFHAPFYTFSFFLNLLTNDFPIFLFWGVISFLGIIMTFGD